ncbi:hypothetical protein EMCRGX_G024614 [Ephydatia muelleri]|eukprot:Em0015g773a
MAWYQPRPVTIEDARRATEGLVGIIQHHLKSETGITPYYIIKAGSLGHGTAVPGEFDLDLVIYTGDIDADQIAGSRDPYRPWLSKIKELLKRVPDVVLEPVDPTRPLGHAVHFTYKATVDVDLLITPTWDSPDGYYQFLRGVEERRRFSFSVGASQWQVEFYSHRPNEVKEYARRAKVWRNKKWPKETGGNGKPKSYFLSILVLKAYERAVQSGQQRIAYNTTLELKNLVKNHKTLDIYWEQYYTLASYRDMIPSPPRIIDPANPSNNLYYTGIGRYYPNSKASDYEEGDGDWTLLVRYIDSIDLTKSVEELQKA